MSTDFTELKLCIDRLPPGQHFSEVAQTQSDNGARAAVQTQKLWQTGRTLRIRFLDGDASIQEKVARFAHEWTQHANIKLTVGREPNAEIRIAFSQPGSWSYIGTDALDPGIARDQPTMNFGWLTPGTPNDEVRRVVLHEFGHALGLIHEHQSPGAAIPWNKEAVYRYYQGPPNHWSKEQVDINLFQLYDGRTTKYSRFDRKSIMLYPIPAEFTLGDFSVGWNNELSYYDKLYIRKWYPFPKRR
jgi:hypothetical protein